MKVKEIDMSLDKSGEEFCHELEEVESRTPLVDRDKIASYTERIRVLGAREEKKDFMRLMEKALAGFGAITSVPAVNAMVSELVEVESGMGREDVLGGYLTRLKTLIEEGESELLA